VKRALIVVLPLLLVAMAVARAGAPGSAEAAVKQTLARTIDAGSSRFTLSWSGLDLPSGEPLKFEGLMDYASHRGRISYGQDSEVIFDGDVTYMKSPLPWRNSAAWLREEGGDDANPLDLQERALSNPTGLLRFLTGAGRDVREVGSEEVHGSRTIHYEGTLDLQKVVDQAPAEARAELQDLLEFMREDEPTTVPFGLWVDSGGVAHRLRMDQSQGGSVLVEYYDFGVPVEITPPAPNEIVNLEDYMKELEAYTDSKCGTGESALHDTLAEGESTTTQSEDAGSSLPETHSESSTVGGGTLRICLSVDTSSAPLDGG
jgi:hypothetical protein